MAYTYRGPQSGNDPYDKKRPNDYPSISINFDSSIIKEFFNIVISGDVNKLDIFLSNNSPEIINIMDKNQENALHKVINTSLPTLTKLNLIKYLISKNISINSQNQMGDTPIALAIQKDNKDIVMELLDNNADINIANKLNISPFHNLAKGSITECEPIEIENFIDDPKPKHDKKAISEIAAKVKEFYNDELLRNFPDDLQNIEQLNTGAKPFPQRLIKYFEHVKSAVKHQLNNNDKFIELEANLGKSINQIVKDQQKSDNEKKLDLEKLKTDFHNKVYKLIKESDAKLEEHIDLTPTAQIDDDGLFLANSNKEYIKTNGTSTSDQKEENVYFKVNGKETMNQYLNRIKLDSNNQINSTIRSLKEKLNKINILIGSGAKDLTDDIVNLNFGIKQINDIARLRYFFKSDVVELTSPNNLLEDHFRVKVDPAGSRSSQIVDFKGQYFEDKYYMKFGINDLNVLTQTNNTANNEFNNDRLNNLSVKPKDKYTLNGLENSIELIDLQKVNEPNHIYLFNNTDNKNSYYIDNNSKEIIKMPDEGDIDQSMKRYTKVREIINGTEQLINWGVNKITDIMTSIYATSDLPPNFDFITKKAALVKGTQDYYDSVVEFWEAEFFRVTSEIASGAAEGTARKRVEAAFIKANGLFVKIQKLVVGLPAVQNFDINNVSTGIIDNLVTPPMSSQGWNNIVGPVATPIPHPYYDNNWLGGFGLYPSSPTLGTARASHVPAAIVVQQANVQIANPTSSGEIATAYTTAYNTAVGNGVAGDFKNGNDIQIKKIADNYLRSAMTYEALNNIPKNDGNKPLHKLEFGWRHYEELLIFLPEILFGGKAPPKSDETKWSKQPQYANGVTPSPAVGTPFGPIYDIVDMTNNNLINLQAARSSTVNNGPNNDLSLFLTPYSNRSNSYRLGLVPNTLNNGNFIAPPLPYVDVNSLNYPLADAAKLNINSQIFSNNLPTIKDAWNKAIFNISSDGMSISPIHNVLTVEGITQIFMDIIKPILYDMYNLVPVATFDKINKFQIEYLKEEDNCKIKPSIEYKLTDDSISSTELNTGYYDLRIYDFQLFNIDANAAAAAAAAPFPVPDWNTIKRKNFELTPFNETEKRDTEVKDLITKSNTLNEYYILLPILALADSIKKLNDYVGTNPPQMNVLNEINKSMDEFYQEYDSALDSNNLRMTYFNDVLNKFHKYYLRYYFTLINFRDDFKLKYNKIIDDIQNNKLSLNNLPNGTGTPPGTTVEHLLNDKEIDLYNLGMNFLENTRFQNIDNEIKALSELIDLSINDLNNLLKEGSKIVTCNSIYNYWNADTDNFNIINFLDSTPKNIKLQDSNLNSNFKFNKYSNHVNIGVSTIEMRLFQLVGLNFRKFPNRGKQSNFDDVKFDASLVPFYYYFSRYRIIEELILYIYNKTRGSAPTGVFDAKDITHIYAKIDSYVKDQIGDLRKENRDPTVLSIIGDLIDNFLISNVKKSIKDAVTEKVNEKLMRNNPTSIGTSVPFIFQSISVPTRIERTSIQQVPINYSAVDFEVDFGLNLGNLDDIIESVATKTNNMSSRYFQELSYGDILVDQLKKTENQIYYASDFLSSINSESKCIKFDIGLINKAIKDDTDLNKQDSFGNSVIYYAVNSQNIYLINELLGRNAKILNIKNNNEQNVFQFTLAKLDVLCKYFKNNDNIIYKMHEYYTKGLKEEILKIGKHHNVVENYDKLIIFYLFLLNADFYNSLYGQNPSLNKKLMDGLRNISLDDIFKTSYQRGNLTSLQINPLEEYLNNNTPVQSDTLENLKAKLEKEKDKLEKEIKYKSLGTDINGLDRFYDNSIVTKIQSINQGKITEINNEIARITTQIDNINTDLGTKPSDAPSLRDRTSDNNQYDLFKQIINLSQIYEDNNFNTGSFLKILNEVSNDKKYYNSTFFYHNLITNIICTFTDKFNKLFTPDISVLDESIINPFKEDLENIKNLMSTPMRNKIIFKNKNKRNIDKNEYIKDEYDRICFTIDFVVGNTFIKVLRRLILTFLKTRYPPKDENKESFLSFVKQKGDLILNKVESYIQPKVTYDFTGSNPTNKYEASELTRKLVIMYGKYKSKDEFSNDDEVDLFKHIIDAIRNNGFEEISESEPIIKHLDKSFLPYFKDYYRICITKLINVINSYENYVMNQYVNIEILGKLVDKLVTPSSDGINKFRYL